MTRFQILLVFLVGYLMATAGLVWEFGQYGLMGAGGLLAVVAAGFIDVRGGGNG